MNPTFILTTNQTLALADLGVDKIYLKKISSSSQSIDTLSNYIRVIKRYEGGTTIQYPIHPLNYFSNRNPGICTDLPMNVPIIRCDLTELSIVGIGTATEFNFSCEYEVITNVIDTLDIVVSSFSEGNIYSLHPSSKLKLRNLFPQAQTAGSLKIDHVTGSLFTAQYGSLTREMVKLLTGLTEDELYKIGQFNFINPRSGEITNSWIFEEPRVSEGY